jgi:hypothetical protein
VQYSDLLDGHHTVQIFAIDNAGNSGLPVSFGWTVDTTPPVTTATPSGTGGNNGWFRSAVSVTLNATDNLSGVAATSYSLDGGVQTPYLGPISIMGNGTHTLTFNSTDNAGNLEKENTIAVKIDTVPPTISYSRTPMPNSYGWNNSTVTVTFTATDSLSGVDGPGSQIVTLSSEGAGQSASATFTDKAGNSATVTVSNINIDRTPPVLTVPANITVYPTSQSGAVVTYPAAMAVDNLTPAPSISITYSAASGSTFPIGNTTVSVTAKDLAGNAMTKTFTIDVLTPAQATGATVATVQNMNLQQGIANSLVSQLQSALDSINSGQNTQAANQLHAFINHVQAQSGKHLTVQQANQLITEAQDIINSLP